MNSEGNGSNISEKNNESRENDSYIGPGMHAFYQEGEWIIGNKGDDHPDLMEEMGLFEKKKRFERSRSCYQYAALGIEEGLSLVGFSRNTKNPVYITVSEDNKGDTKRIVENLLGLGVIKWDTRVCLSIFDKDDRNNEFALDCPAFEIAGIATKREHIKYINPKQYASRKESDRKTEEAHVTEITNTELARISAELQEISSTLEESGHTGGIIDEDQIIQDVMQYKTPYNLVHYLGTRKDPGLKDGMTIATGVIFNPYYRQLISSVGDKLGAAKEDFLTCHDLNAISGSECKIQGHLNTACYTTGYSVEAKHGKEDLIIITVVGTFTLEPPDATVDNKMIDEFLQGQGNCSETAAEDANKYHVVEYTMAKFLPSETVNRIKEWREKQTIVVR